MFSALQGYNEREKLGIFAVHTALASGLAVDPDTSVDTNLTNTSPYGTLYGRVVVANCVAASNTIRELGWLEQPVTTSGPSLLEILSQVYDESVPVDANAVVVISKAGALIATDQYLASGTGHIAFDGSVHTGTICGIASGKPRVLQSGDAPRLRLLAQVVQRKIACAAFQVL